ncbi:MULTISPECIES: hypothetical protein [unclassified Microcoleus]|uniref:hypothetical protein n=1 Tax=unclassified Microcoleus TaxID=2642155 RepID=UPI0025DF9E8C|nr:MULTISPECIES: hypothetical protein [unclassified Microcoleus]
MGFVSKDAAGDRADKAGGSNSKPKSNQKVETDMSSAPESRENPIDRVFDKIEDILSETWEETGFGKVTIESEREKKNLIRVTVKGSTHYRYLIADEDVEEWKSRT